MAEAVTDSDEDEFKLKDGLKLIFGKYEVKPSAILDDLDCLKPHEMDVIRRMENQNIGTAIDELFDRLVERPLWVGSFVKGINHINNNFEFPNGFYKEIDSLFATIPVTVKPGYLTDETGKICLSKHCSPKETISSTVNKVAVCRPVVLMRTENLNTVSAKLIKSRYSIFKKNLHAIDEICDKLEEENVLSKYEIDDIKILQPLRAKIDVMLKTILKKGETACRKFLEIIKSEYCGSQDYLLTIDTFMIKVHDIIDNSALVIESVGGTYNLLMESEPHIEELMDLLVETDSFSLDDHSDVIEPKPRKERISVLIKKLDSEDKIDALVRALDFLEREKTFGMETEVKQMEVDITDGSQLLLHQNNDEQTPLQFDFRVSIESSVVPDVLRQIKQRIDNDIVSQLADQLANLKLNTIEDGSVIIEFEASSKESLDLLRQAYLKGTLVNTIMEMLQHTGIQEMAKEGEMLVEIQIGFSKDRAKRRNLHEMKHVQLLDRNHYFLIEELDPFSVLQAMEKKQLLTGQQVEWILTKEPRGRRSAVKELINMLKWMDPSCFEFVLATLKDGSQSYIYDHITRHQNQELLREIISNKQLVIAEEMHLKMLRIFSRKLKITTSGAIQQRPTLTFFATRELKQSILQHIIKATDEENVFILEDLLHASGIGKLVEFKDIQKDTDQKMMDTYAKVFEELFHTLIPENITLDISEAVSLPQIVSSEVKDGNLHLNFKPENILQVRELMKNYENGCILKSIENWILGEGQQRRKRINEINDKLGISLKDIGFAVDMDHSKSDIARSWLNKTKGPKNFQKKMINQLPATYQRLLEDPLMTETDKSEFLESKEKLLWIKQFVDKNLARIEEKTLYDTSSIAVRIYNDCSPDKQVTLKNEDTSEDLVVMYSKTDPDNKVYFQRSSLDALLNAKIIIQIDSDEDLYQFKSELILVYMVAREGTFIWDTQHLQLFPFSILFNSSNFLKFMTAKEEGSTDVVTEKMHEIIMMYDLDQREINDEVLGSQCIDESFYVPGRLLSFETKYVLRLLMKKDRLRQVVMERKDDTSEKEKGQGYSEDLVKFDINRNKPVFVKLLFRKGSWIDVLKMCQIVSVIDGGDVKVVETKGPEFNCSVFLRANRHQQHQFDDFILEISGVQLVAEMIPGICKSLPVMENLMAFKARDTGLTSKSAQAIMSSLSNSGLLQLCLNCNDLSNWNSCGFDFAQRLEILEMSNCKLSDDTVMELAKDLSFLHSLEVIDLGHNAISATGIAILCKPLGNLKSLKALRVQKNILGVESGVLISELLEKLPNIEIINLSGCKLGDEGIRSISNVLAEKCIRKINLRENGISLRESGTLLRSLAKKSKYLQYFDFSGNEIGKQPKSTTEKAAHVPHLKDEGELHLGAPEALIDLLKTNASCLDYLCLWNCGLGYTKVFENINDSNFLNGLTNLCLQDNSLNDQFAESIGSCMKNSWHSLRHLNLTHNGISDRGVNALLEGLKLNIKLEELYLNGNKVRNPETMSKLFKSVTTPDHTMMKELDISLNSIREMEREYLRQEMTRKGDLKSIKYEDGGKITSINHGKLHVRF